MHIYIDYQWFLSSVSFLHVLCVIFQTALNISQSWASYYTIWNLRFFYKFLIKCLYKGQRYQLYSRSLCLYHTIGSLNPKSRKRKQRGSFCHLNQAWQRLIAFTVCNPSSSWWTANASVWTANSIPARPAAAITRKSVVGCVTPVAWPGLKTQMFYYFASYSLG